ncbi:hypothetical protein TNCT_716681 [Trichonephila clavata]|uniref:Uncharacterized protein n=1 Tax=Trichonephila clavata TaxID=2740835 RepID=A0A8X6FKA6_TRICU|nr:hypothetical protein TNCT_716681 [Trichonephila clavata]
MSTRVNLGQPSNPSTVHLSLGQTVRKKPPMRRDRDWIHAVSESFMYFGLFLHIFSTRRILSSSVPYLRSGFLILRVKKGKRK